MIINKNEASKKMCPYGREYIWTMSGEIVTVNMERGKPFAKCLTDKCMSWEDHAEDKDKGFCRLIEPIVYTK